MGLEYVLGTVQLSFSIKLTGDVDPYDDGHKFVVEHKENKLIFHTKTGACHSDVVYSLKLDEDNIVGGGSVFINDEDELMICDYSGSYGAITTEIGAEFAKLLIPKVEEEYNKILKSRANLNNKIIDQYHLNNCTVRPRLDKVEPKLKKLFQYME